MRRVLLGLLGAVAVLVIAAGIALHITANEQNPQGVLSVPSLAPPTTVAAPTGTATSQPPAAPPVLQDVGLFMPVSLDVFTPNGQLNPERVQIYQGKLVATSDGIDPPAQPGVLTDADTTLPGTGQGTTAIWGHSQSSPPLVFNFLSDLTQADVDGGSQVVLYGPEGQQLVYQIDSIPLIDKDKLDTHREFRDRTAGRLLLITCHLDHGNDSYQNLVVIAHLVSSKFGP